MNSTAKVIPSRVTELFGAAHVTNDPNELAAHEVDVVRPGAVARPGTVKEIAELVTFAAAEGLAVIATGARTKLGIGMPPSRYDLALAMTRLDRVISYDPGDLTVSVEAGIPVAKLAATLAEHKQILPLTVPFHEQTTVGGTLASGVDSPLRQMYGTARDFVLGMEFVTGAGVLAKSGGRVVKNVSGYDLHKLMIGAIGSLGIITRVNFKTFPLPAETRGWIAGFARAEEAFAFAQKVRKSPLAPCTVEVFDRRIGEVLSAGQWLEKSEWGAAISAAGNEKVMERCARDLQAMARGTNASAFSALDESARGVVCECIREFPVLIAKQSPSAVIVKVTALPAQLAETVQRLQSAAAEGGLPCATLARGAGVMYFALLPAERDAGEMARLAPCARQIFSAATKSSQHAMIPWCPVELKRDMNIWGAPREDFPLMQRVKQAFDPHGIFAPGRFVGGL